MHILDSQKAFDITTIPLPDQSGLADTMVIASGTSSRHVSALADKIKDALSNTGVKGIKTEGLAQSDWVVIDSGDVIVHLFHPEMREFYEIERMWGADLPNKPPPQTHSEYTFAGA